MTREKKLKPLSEYRRKARPAGEAQTLRQMHAAVRAWADKFAKDPNNTLAPLAKKIAAREEAAKRKG